jgi:succinate-semialdehyde dehydrogenase/glutarate-semialdehyde dehydrogenase
MPNVHALQSNESENQVETINPATEEVVKTFTQQSAEEVSRLIDKAHEAHLKWREKSLEERGKIIKQIAKKLEEHKDDLAEMMAKEMGKVKEQGIGEIDRCIWIANYTADEDYKNLLDEERPLKDGKKGIISYEPLGVIFGIQPWNFPAYQVLRYTIPNLMAGNAVLLKHAQNVWGCAEKVAEILKDAGVPEHLFTSLYIDHEVAESIFSNDKIRGITFTGSAKGGAAVAKQAGENIKKSVLELGGADPYIVLDDVDMDKVIPVCVKGRCGNAGQTCVAAKRFIIVESRYEEFKEKFKAAMQKVKYGNPLEEGNDMGPIARKDLREKLHDQVQKSIEKGAKVVLGCELPEGKGYFYPASILENIQPGMPAYDEELFGPVAGLFKAKDEDDAIRIANDHEYGLGGGVFCNDEDHAIKVARRIETGMVSVNGFYGSQANLPFGGVKNSGYGREHGGFGITEFVNIKSIYVGENK